MNAKELRIGNWVVGESDPKKRPTTATLEVIEYSHLFEGIPLTEDWLLKFGFDKIGFDGDDGYIKDGIFLRQNDGFGVVVHDDTFPDIDIYYVHQLQNFFHVINGQELELQDI